MTYQVTKRELLEHYSNCYATNWFYLIHGKIYNDEHTRYYRFKFVIWFDGCDYGEWLSDCNLKDTKANLKDYLENLIDSYVDNIAGMMNGKYDKEHYKKVVEFCNDTINTYNARNKAA